MTDREQAPGGDVARDVLVVDGDAGVRDGLGGLLREAGFEVTAVAEEERAQDQLANRFFAVLLVDLDTPGVDGGLALAKYARDHSPLTAVIVLSARRTFDAAAAAFRLGVFDVVPKAKEHLGYLRQRVRDAAAALKSGRDHDRLLADVSEVHERFLANMVALFRKVSDLEEKLLREADDTDPAAFRAPAPPLDLLIVDDEPALGSVVRDALAADTGWQVRLAESGGSALDAASQRPPRVLLVKETLPDLPASMLIKTLRAASPELVALVYHAPTADAPGEVRRHDVSRATNLGTAFTGPDQLLEALAEIKEALPRMARERRQLAAFRNQHSDFLRLYSGLRQRLGERL